MSLLVYKTSHYIRAKTISYIQFAIKFNEFIASLPIAKYKDNTNVKN